MAVRPVNLARLIASMVGQPGAPLGTAASRFGRTLASPQGHVKPRAKRAPGFNERQLDRVPILNIPIHAVVLPRVSDAPPETLGGSGTVSASKSASLSTHNVPESTNDSRSAAIGAAHEIGPLRKPTACLLTLAPMQCCETCVARCCCDGSSRQTARGRTGYDVSALGRASAVCPL